MKRMLLGAEGLDQLSDTPNSFSIRMKSLMEPSKGLASIRDDTLRLRANLLHIGGSIRKTIHPKSSRTINGYAKNTCG